ncbi:winged helix-turn-helix domain-containing protein [Halomicrobium urmianum]|uniref:winged helix-turn-helix domain-containing protein n=1 Tax=Halomicrobium urmianum TaxID=1586233 RepID=UPI001CD9F7AD|nr:helix-turn-helix domain-containing protein [Halomicrobium urmianum]
MDQTRLTPSVDLDGLSPEEAFSVLGDETRLAIVRVLWEAGAAREYDDVDDSEGTMTFSDLRRAVDLKDNGRFNYHLTKLRPHFVRQTEDGYRLSGAGKKIARTVVAISGGPASEFTTDLDLACPICGAPVAAAYEDQWLRYRCTECEGLFGDAAPEGAIMNTAFPAAGIAGRDPREALTVSLYRCIMDLTYLLQGVCRECAGDVAGSVSICEDHDTGDGGVCDACGAPFPVWAELQCETCRFGKHLPIEFCVMGVPTVVGHLAEGSVDVLPPSIEDMVEVVGSRIETTVDRDPLRVIVTVRGGTETVSVTFDEAATPVEVAY